MIMHRKTFRVKEILNTELNKLCNVGCDGRKRAFSFWNVCAEYGT